MKPIIKQKMFRTSQKLAIRSKLLTTYFSASKENNDDLRGF